MKMWKLGLEIVKFLEKNGYEAYLVGGCVRDYLLKRPFHDVDICTSARPEEIMKLFERIIPTGIEHGTISVIWKEKVFEVTTFRSEGKYANFRKPMEVYFETSLTEDLSRRDFTINAMAMNSSLNIIDIFDGQKDLHNKIIRTVGLAKERFHEDALRMLRAIRFSAQLDFAISSEALQAMQELTGLLHYISKERITSEIMKIIEGPYLKKALHFLIQSNIAQKVSPFKEMEKAISSCSKLPIDEMQAIERWLLLPLLLPEEKQRVKLLKYLTLPKSFRKELHRLLMHYQKIRAIKSYKELPLLDIINIGANDLKKLIHVHSILQNDALHTVNSVDSFFMQLPIQDMEELQISGAEISSIVKKEPGPWIKATIDKLADAVLQGKINNQKEDLVDYLLGEEYK